MTIDTAPQAIDFFEEYQRSLNHPEAFWAEKAEEFISWEHPWNHVKKGSFDTYV